MAFPLVCPVCGKYKAEYPDATCRTCKNSALSGEVPSPGSSDHIPEIWSCRRYEGIMRDCIKEFKYKHNKGMLKLFDEVIRGYISGKAGPREAADLVVPVPLHWRRLNSRGYNQSELIARAFSDKIQRPLFTRNLIKIKNTVPQSGLSKKTRTRNIRDSFTVLHPCCVSGKSVMLVDDVMTTGATLDACAKELLRAGAGKVTGFTIARTL